MDNCKDLIEFYVFHDKHSVPVFKNLDDAIKAYKEIIFSDNKDYCAIGIQTTALVKSPENFCFDLVGYDVTNALVMRINDYKIVTSTHSKYSQIINESMKHLIAVLNIQYQFSSEKNFGFTKNIIVPIKEYKGNDAYGKFPLPSNDKYPCAIPYNCINEVAVRNYGWRTLEELKKIENPVVELVNCSYVDIYGSYSQMDMIFDEYQQFIQVYKHHYLLSMYDACIDKSIIYASFDDLNEAIQCSYEIHIPYLLEDKKSTVAVIDSIKNSIIMIAKIATDGLIGNTKEKTAEQYGIDFSQQLPQYPVIELYANSLEDVYTQKYKEYIVPQQELEISLSVSI